MVFVAVFSQETDATKAQKKLDGHFARKQATKELWLLRESSVSGLLTVTFFCKEENSYKHQRIGFVNNDWRNAPKNRDEAVEFTKQAILAFKDQLPEGSVEKLFKLLTACNFKLYKQIIPEKNEATYTPQLIGYITDGNDACQFNSMNR